ncbi:MAG: MerC domain-containing protein [Bacteroidetes bacterium]|nr:MerC domain-containing protein [Bacteroidota bacterium]
MPNKISHSIKIKHSHGAWLSIICGIHCLLMPFVVTLLPLAGSSFFINPMFEITLVVLSAMVSGLIVFRDAKKYHGNYKLLLLIVAGFALILSSHFVFDRQSIIISLMGPVMVLTALYFNWQLHKKYHVH